MDQNKISSKQIWFGILLVALLTVGYLISNLLTFEKEKGARKDIVTEIVKEVIIKRPTCPDTADAFSTLRKVTLAEDLVSYGVGGGFVNRKFTLVKITGSGSQVACGYLYAKAHTRKGALKQYENIYVKPDQFGGHILGDSIVNKEHEGKTELLFNLSKITYRSTLGAEIRKADWAALLNVTDRVRFEIALNTEDRGGTIDELSIAYQCWSPETGQITQDCQLLVENL